MASSSRGSLEEAPVPVPRPQASAVRLYLTPRSISERAWVLCVCLSSDRRRPPREGPSLNPLHAHTASLMLRGGARWLGSKLRVSWYRPPDKALPCHMNQPESQTGKDSGYITPQRRVPEPTFQKNEELAIDAISCLTNTKRLVRSIQEPVRTRIGAGLGNTLALKAQRPKFNPWDPHRELRMERPAS